MNIKALALATSALALAAGAQAQDDTLKIAYIEGMSGPFANTGDSGLKHFTYAAEQINEAGGAGGRMIEIVPFDSKTNPKEALVQLQKAIDQGIRFITQGNGSSVASALIDGVDKHNARNPGEEILFLNYAAVDPAFTNDDCSFWHFRFDADADMKMEALTDYISGQDDIRSVYIIGQDYSFGKAVADAAVRMLEEKAPEVEVVGNELHPLGKVKDFTPYVQKIMSSGADAVITGNWGQDMTLLIKAAADSGHDKPYLTYYGGGLGAPTAMGESALGLVKQISEFHENIPTDDEAQKARMQDFEDRFGGLDLYYQRVFTLMDMFDKAADAAEDVTPTNIALQLEGMTHQTPYGEVRMREDNHQLIQPMFISTFSDEVERGVEGLPYGFKTDEGGEIAAEATVMETSCQMDNRPES
jgi:branched-chain amino acid transport system substrate-binding protein